MALCTGALLPFALLISFLINISISADCQAQSIEKKCQLVSGCEWFNNGCICATEVKVDIIFAIDRSGSIGSSSFKQAKEWLSDFVQKGLPKDPRIGFVYFASLSNSDASDITLTTYHINDISTLVAYIDTIKYTGGSTHTEYALDHSITEYNSHGDPSRQKLIIMITDGRPNCNGCDICTRASTLKTMNIRVIILGVGSSLTEKYVECLLQDTTTDYIPVTSYNYDDFQKIMPALQEITCPVSYNMKLTEVKPQTDTDPSFGSKFIEIWNIGSTVNGADLRFDGLVTGTLPNTVSVQQSHYLVLYEIDSTFENVTCINCICNTLGFHSPYSQLTSSGFFCDGSLYYPCSISTSCSFNNNMDKTNWTQSIYDVSDNADQLIDSVNILQNNFPVILDGWTVELKEIGFDNTAGGNWEQSCYNTGTPGDPPIDCPHADCSDETCQQNGASASKNPSTGVCTCPTEYYPTGCTCKKVPNPSNCLAERIKQNTSTWYTLYEWDRVDYDEQIQYELKYENDGGVITTVTSYGLIKTVLNYNWNERRIIMSAGELRSFITVNDIDYYSETANCMPITQNPTTEPTPAPSVSPIPAPTNNPTQSPIHLLPWLFIGGGICEMERCQCGIANLIKNKTCCMMDNNNNNCTVYNKQYPFIDGPNYITIQSYDKFGKTYAAPFDTIVYYKFEYLGLQNLSDIDSNDGQDNTGEPEVTGSQDSDDNNNKYKNCKIPDISPVIITPMNGSIMFNKADLSIINNNTDISSTSSITFYIEASGEKPVKCKGNAIFKLSLLNCNSSYTLNMNEECQIVYPNEYILYIEQPNNQAALTWWEKEGKAFIWWLIAALAAILLLVSFLLYKFWWKTRLKGKAITDKENEMQNLIEEEELGMAPDLNQNQIGFNPLALGGQGTGGVGSGNIGMHVDDKIPENQRANVIVEKFDDRQEYGPQAHGYQPPMMD
eukprot:435321_1